MKYEVVIIGAGPAGSTAAKFLSENGVNVLLIDKSKFPRDKPCGGGIPIRVFKRFPYLEEDCIDSYSYAAFAYSPSLKNKMELQRNEPLVAMILRKKFDYKLVKYAINSGSKFIDGKSAQDIKILKNYVKIFLNDGNSIESDIVIGADGVWSNIAKKTRLRKNLTNICMCLFEEYHLNNKTLDRFLGEKRTCHIHFNVNRSAGYGWVFPKKEHVNIGITEFQHTIDPLKRKKNLKDTYKSYIKILKKQKIIPDNLKMGRVIGAALPTRPLEKTYSDRLILCGDAAGFANPVSGEGIYHAMSSAEIAAEVVIEALEKNNTSEKFLSRYQKIWNKDFGKDLKILYRTSMFWGKDNDKFIDTICKDKKLSEFAVDAIIGRIDARKFRKKMIRRMSYLKVRDRFVKQQSETAD